MDVFMNHPPHSDPGPNYNMRPSWHQPPKPYGCFSFLFDIIMTCLTGGLWLIWIFVREMRKRA